MKLVIIGFGQCGGKIADEFGRINARARSHRGIEIIADAFAVNTDVTDLSSLSSIKSDYRHRILIGSRKTGGHGVGKINELGAEIARDDGDKVIDAIRGTKRFYESDAFLLIASAGGGTGSGAIPVITEFIKERYPDKPVYDLVVLPFEHEETTEERSIYNSALCLKSVNMVADAVILADNQRYIRKDASLRNNLSKINELIAEPFFDLLCAGEEKKQKFIGAKTLDAGDIMQTVTGWTAIGYGRTEVSMFNLPFSRKSDFRNKSTEIHKGIQTMDEAISELSINCNPSDASRALYLLSAPHKEMNMDLIKELGDYLKDIAPEAIIRTGDYPREKGPLNVTVMLSELSGVSKIIDYFTKTIELIDLIKRKREGIQVEHRDLSESFRDIPSLL